MEQNRGSWCQQASRRRGLVLGFVSASGHLAPLAATELPEPGSLTAQFCSGPYLWCPGPSGPRKTWVFRKLPSAAVSGDSANIAPAPDPCAALGTFLFPSFESSVAQCRSFHEYWLKGNIHHLDLLSLLGHPPFLMPHKAAVQPLPAVVSS